MPQHSGHFFSNHHSSADLCGPVLHDPGRYFVSAGWFRNVLKARGTWTLTHDFRDGSTSMASSKGMASLAPGMYSTTFTADHRSSQ